REPGGVFDLVYYAGKGDNDASGSYRRARSSDGKTREPSTAIQTPVTYLQARDSPQWVRGYTGLARFSGSLFTGHLDHHGGASHSASSRTQTQYLEFEFGGFGSPRAQ